MDTQDFEIKELENGTPVLFITHPDSETTTIGVTFNVGGRNESSEIDGISHFLEHQFFKGNEDLGLTPMRVNEEIDSLGGVSNAFTWFDATCYLTKCISENFDRSITLWDQLLHFGEISQEEFDKECFVVKQEFQRFLDNHPFYLRMKIHGLLFQGTSLEMTVIGNEKTLSSITLPTMEEYRNKHYGFENAAIMVLGNFNKKKAWSQLDQTFGSRPILNEKPTYAATSYEPAPQPGMKYFSITRKIPLSYFGTAVKIAGGRSPDRFSLEILASLLSNGRNSLIQRKLVRPGICAYANAAIELFEDVGVFNLTAGVLPQKMTEAVKTVFEMLYELYQTKTTGEILMKAVNQIEYEYRTTYEEPFQMLFRQALEYWRRGHFYSLEEDLDSLRKVTVDQFNKVKQSVLENLNGVFGMVGSVDEYEPRFPLGTWEGKFTLVDLEKNNI